MKKDKQGKTRASERYRIRLKWWLLLIALGIVVFLGAFWLVTALEKKDTLSEAKQMLDYLQTICDKYDDYELGNTTKDLQALINKANNLRYNMTQEQLTDRENLQKYMTYQYLTGIIVLDSDCRVECNADRDDRSVGNLLGTIL